MALTDEAKQRIEEEERFRAAARAKAEKKAAKPCRGGLLPFGIYVAIILGVPTWWFTQSSPEPKTAEQLVKVKVAAEEKSCNSDNSLALAMAQNFVKATLKSPSTAEFPGTWEAVIRNIGFCTYEITSYVDAENSVGAKLRTKYFAVVHYDGHDHWSQEQLEILNQSPVP